MEMHNKIMELLKTEFPALNLPEIPEGYGVFLCIVLNRHTVEPGDSVKELRLDYCSKTGNFIYTPWLDGYNSAQSVPTDLEQTKERIEWAKSTGTVTVAVDITLIVPEVTV